MKRVEIQLPENFDESDELAFIFPEVSKMISEGFTSGIDCPVTWHIFDEANYNFKISSIQIAIKSLKDYGDKHSRIINALENLKIIER